MRQKIITFIISLVGIGLIVSFSRDIYVLWQKGKEIGKAERELEKAKIKNEDFKKRLSYVQTDEFIEKEAREKLGLGKEGETVLILPENFAESLKKEEVEMVLPEDKANWERWRDLFF